MNLQAIYRTTITDFFKPALHGVCDVEVATGWCNLPRIISCYIRFIALDRLVSRNGDYNWTPRNYGLTPLNYFLVKEKCYADIPEIIEHLNANIAEIQTYTLVENEHENRFDRRR